jgi:hypothetical protein
LRPKNLQSLLERFAHPNQVIYVFIDYAGGSNRELNLEVLNVAKQFIGRCQLYMKVSTVNLGVGLAVPRGIEWISENETKFIILEDDCQLTLEGYDYFIKNSYLLDDTVALISATSPWDTDLGYMREEKLTLSTYPLISGWATNADNWEKMSIYIDKKTPYLKAIISAFKQPKRIIQICFFLSSHIKVRGKLVKAWDSSIALWLVLNSKYVLIPNITMVTNTGKDAVASHTVPFEGESEIFRLATKGFPSNLLDFSEESFKKTNRRIEKVLYKMTFQNLFSPVKAIILVTIFKITKSL